MTTATRDAYRVSPPRQARSRRTLEKILAALEELLEDRPFEDITVREIVRRSGTSTGSFYARFPTRETLLPALYDRYDASLRELAGQRFGPPEGAALREATLEDVVRVLARRVLARHRERKWLMRAVALHARQHPELIPDEQRRRRMDLHREWRDLLLRHRDRMSHPDPEAAVAFGLFMIVTACREKVVFDRSPHASSFELSDDRLVEEMVVALLAYLGVRNPDERAREPVCEDPPEAEESST